MEIKQLSGKLGNILWKYRYAALILIIGMIILLIPGKKISSEIQTEEIDYSSKDIIHENSLEEVLQTIQGAGNVKIFLSIASGEEILFQNNTDLSGSGENRREQVETVLVTDSQRTQNGLIRQINPPKYLGAIVVCEGADNPAVKLAITQAVSKVTGLGTDHICVLKMK